MNGERGPRAVGLRAIAAAVGIAIAALCAGPTVRAQKATEQYIPIGQSPGISRKHTSLGVIDSVGVLQQTITVADPGGRRTIRITTRTGIWLDRSRLKLPNLRGRFADLQRGRRVEVKYLDAGTRQVAEWVKVEMLTP